MRAVWIGARFICALLPAEEDEQDEDGDETLRKIEQNFIGILFANIRS